MKTVILMYQGNHRMKQMLIHPQVVRGTVYRQVPSRTASDFALDPVQRRLLRMLEEDLREID